MKSVKGYDDDCHVLEQCDCDALKELIELLPALRKLCCDETHKEEVHKAAKSGASAHSHGHPHKAKDKE